MDVDSDSLSHELQNLAEGREQGWSIGCAVPYDVCSVCGTKRKTLDESCEHLDNQLGMALDSGGIVHAINDKMRFDDISVVNNKADYIAYGLLKVASHGKVVGGAELYRRLRGEPNGLPKQSALKIALSKMSEMEKEIPATLNMDSPVTQSAVLSSLDDVGVEPDALVKKLAFHHVPPTRFLAELAKYKVILSAKDFLRILSGDVSESATSDAIASMVEKVLPSAFTRTLVDDQVPEDIENAFEGSSNIPLPPCIKKIVSHLASTMSFTHADQPNRVRVVIIQRGTPMQKVASVSPIDPVIESLAQAYTLYKAASCADVDNYDLTKRVVISHYIQ